MVRSLQQVILIGVYDSHNPGVTAQFILASMHKVQYIPNCQMQVLEMGTILMQPDHEEHNAIVQVV